MLNTIEGMAQQGITYNNENFSKFSTVWSQSRDSFVNEFITTAGGLSEPDKVTEQQVQLPPSLEQFGEQLLKYRNSHSDIRLIQDSKSFGWLRIYGRPLKQSLDLNLGKWVYLFTHYLNNVMDEKL
ncbi:MAG: hypothetical protein Ta2E_11770 [Mycoplasmoidaceae bacterium]|nr:MAG: hypothetical protein Ta2E_11770 [Mycoplasmoidaceae bacterium]